MKTPKTNLVFTLVLLFSALLLACGGDDTDTPDAVGTADTGVVDSSDSGISDSDSTAMTWTPTMYRTTHVNVTRPNHVAGILTGLINPEIDINRLHVLIETSDFEAESGGTSFRMRGDAGDVDDEGNYYFVGSSTTYLSDVDESGYFINEELAKIDFPVVFGIAANCVNDDCPDGCRDDLDCDEGFTCDVEDTGECIKTVVLPLHDVLISGHFEQENGLQILRGTEIMGAILKDDADVLEIDLGGGELPVLSEILGDSFMDYPEDSDELIGWQLTADLNADQVTSAASNPSEDMGSSEDMGAGDMGSSEDMGAGDMGSSEDMGAGDMGSSEDMGAGDTEEDLAQSDI